ncbi:MAG: DivIVA domain-containing protein [Balneolaceae bacterium]
MKLTPIEIKQQQFEKSLRGYDVADVQAFLTLVSNEYEHLLTKNKELEDQIEKLGDRVRHYERVEEALHETLQTTKESVAQKMDNARLEAKNRTDKAQMEAEGIIQEANQQRAHIRQSILRLLDRRDEIISGISSYLDNAKTSIDKFSKDELGIFALPHDEVNENSSTPEEEKNKSRFKLDEEEVEQDDSNSEEMSDITEDDNGFPPGSDRLNDILDEID